MKLAVLKETHEGETRVAASQQSVAKLTRLGLEVLIEAGAGSNARISDEEYESAGATIYDDIGKILSEAKIVLKVCPPCSGGEGTRDEIALLAPSSVFVGMLSPVCNPEVVQRLARGTVTSFSLDLLPRVTRAQSMDVLSSMSTLAGFKAVIMAANRLERMQAMMMTAAGTLQPAHTLVIGAGVAGLQAIATARRLGSLVTAADVRPSAAEQVQSLGAKFISIEIPADTEDAQGYAKDLGEDFYKQQQQVLAPYTAAASAVITTALIPFRTAPMLISAEMVEAMKPGSVIVDLAAATGGNGELTQPDEIVTVGGVTILGPTNLPATMPMHASQMYANNIAAFLGELITDQGQLVIDMDNEIITETMVTHGGRVLSDNQPKQSTEATEQS